MKDKKEIGTAFNERLGDFSKSPKGDLWSNIEKELDGEKKNRKGLWLWFFGGGTLLLALAIGVAMSTTGKVVPTNMSTKVEAINEEKHVEISPISEENGHLNSERKVKETDEIETPLKQIESPQKSNQITTKIEQKISSESNILMPKVNEVKSSVNIAKSHPKVEVAILSNAEMSENKIENTWVQNVGEVEEEIYDFPSEVMATKGEIEVKDKGENILSTNKKSVILPIEILSLKVAFDQDTSLPDYKLPSKIEDVPEKSDDDDDDDDDDKPKTKRWFVGVDYGNNIYRSFNSDSGLDTSLNNNRIEHNSRFNFALELGYNINEKWQVSTGAKLHKTVTQTNDIPRSNIIVSPFFEIDIDDEFWSVGTSSIFFDTFNLIQKIDYLEIPLELKYRIKKGKVGLDVRLGGSAFILLNQELMEEFDQFEITTSELNKLSYSANIGLGVNYEIIDNLTIGVSSKLNNRLNVYNDSSINKKPYIVAFNVGLGYTF